MPVLYGVWVKGLNADGLDGPTGAQGLTGVLIQGANGITGINGITGANGITGLHGLEIRGITGVDGITGDAGFDWGDTGAQGLTGVMGIGGGVKGETGDQGSVGVVGENGLIGESIQGPTGNQGDTGIAGILGYLSIKGFTGVQGQTGVTGIIGLQGVTGPNMKGLTGPLGETGTPGIKGFPGLQGSTGIQGDTGLNGLAGAQGLTGVNGLTGSQGLIAVDASSTIKLATARTVTLSEKTKASGSFDGSADLNLKASFKGDRVTLDSSHYVSGTPWYKIATITVIGSSTDRELALLVNRRYASERAKGSGILKIYTKSTANGSHSGASICWMQCTENINPLDFCLEYSNAVTGSTVYNVWFKATTKWEVFTYEVVCEGSSTTTSHGLWTLFDRMSPEELPTTNVQFSSIATALNPNIRGCIIDKTSSFDISTGSAGGGGNYLLAKAILDGSDIPDNSDIVPIYYNRGAYITFYYSERSFDRSSSFNNYNLNSGILRFYCDFYWMCQSGKKIPYLGSAHLILDYFSGVVYPTMGWNIVGNGIDVNLGTSDGLTLRVYSKQGFDNKYSAIYRSFTVLDEGDYDERKTIFTLYSELTASEQLENTADYAWITTGDYGDVVYNDILYNVDTVDGFHVNPVSTGTSADDTVTLNSVVKVNTENAMPFIGTKPIKKIYSPTGSYISGDSVVWPGNLGYLWMSKAGKSNLASWTQTTTTLTASSYLSIVNSSDTYRKGVSLINDSYTDWNNNFNTDYLTLITPTPYNPIPYLSIKLNAPTGSYRYTFVALVSCDSVPVNSNGLRAVLKVNSTFYKIGFSDSRAFVVSDELFSFQSIGYTYSNRHLAFVHVSIDISHVYGTATTISAPCVRYDGSASMTFYLEFMNQGISIL
jgi:hypothetical protein